MNASTESIILTSTETPKIVDHTSTSDVSFAKGFLIAQLVLLIILLIIVMLIVYLVNKLGIEMINQYNSYRFYNHVISPSKRNNSKLETKFSNDSISKQYKHDQRPTTSYYVDYEATTPKTNNNNMKNLEYDDSCIEPDFQYPVTSSARKKLKYGQTETIKQQIKMKRSQSWDMKNNQLCKDFSMHTIHNRTNDFIVGIDEEE